MATKRIGIYYEIHSCTHAAKWLLCVLPAEAGLTKTPFGWSLKMAWKTPKISEVSVGMEINLYVCAEL